MIDKILIFIQSTDTNLLLFLLLFIIIGLSVTLAISDIITDKKISNIENMIKEMKYE